MITKEYVEKKLTEENIYYIYQDAPSEHFVCIINKRFVIFNIGKDFYLKKKKSCKSNGGFYFRVLTEKDFVFYLESMKQYDKEEWRTISIYNDLPYEYQISDKGRIFNKTRKVFLRPSLKANGYLEVQLSKKHYCLVHRLVASVFIDNPDDKPFVNHIDGDKTNNNKNNLEWVTESENVQHYYKTIRTSSEKVLENKIKNYLFEKGHLFVKIHGSKFMVPGISDILACICGRFVAIEIKAPGLKSHESPQQKIFGENVIKSNGLYYLVDSLDEVIELVEGIEAEELLLKEER